MIISCANIQEERNWKAIQFIGQGRKLEVAQSSPQQQEVYIHPF